MDISFKALGVLTLTLGLVACGGDDNDSPLPTPVPTPTPEPVVTTIVDVAVDNGGFTTLVAALQATQLDAVLDNPEGNFTVFAPTDAAFALLGQDTINALLADTDTLSDILLYHVISGAEVDSTTAVASAGTTVEMANGDKVGLSLSGDALLVNTATVTMVDIAADNGIIHVLDAVLLPPAEMGEPTDSIVDIAVGHGSFTTLVSALQAAGLVETLADETATFTVFAPTDDAFAKIDSELLANIVADTDTLSAILLQHVVSGAAVDSVTAYSLNGGNATTASDAEVGIEIMDGGLYVGGSMVTVKDIYATNGIIHVIDTVIVGDVPLP